MMPIVHQTWLGHGRDFRSPRAGTNPWEPSVPRSRCPALLRHVKTVLDFGLVRPVGQDTGAYQQQQLGTLIDPHLYLKGVKVMCRKCKKEICVFNGYSIFHSYKNILISLNLTSHHYLVPEYPESAYIL